MFDYLHCLSYYNSKNVPLPRVCLVEASATDTQLLATVLNKLDVQAADESIDEVDRRHLSRGAALLRQMKTASADEVAEGIVTKCVDVDEPVFRHPLFDDDLKAATQKAVSDLTGEAAVAFGRTLIGAS